MTTADATTATAAADAHVHFDRYHVGGAW